MGMKQELQDLSTYVWERTRARVEGLTDEEYLWEPVAGAWTVRTMADGATLVDRAVPEPEPAPFTTIAWRLRHLIGCYGQSRNARMMGVPIQAGSFDDPNAAPPTAKEAVDALEHAAALWHRDLDATTDESLVLKIGPVGEQYADYTRASFAMHMLDEFVHHGAEIALLRDLYRETFSPRDESWRESLAVAASLGRWHLMAELIASGLDVNAADDQGRTALHLAAGAGRADVVRLLLDAGADASVTDPVWHATPRGWAEYFGRRDVLALLP